MREKWFRDGQVGGRFTSADYLVFAWWSLNAILFGHVVLAQPPLWVTYLYNALLYICGGVLSYHNRTIRRVFVLASIAGVVELVADYFLVAVTGTLSYPTGLPMLLSSPAYMPLAWAIVTTQLGYLGIRLKQTVGQWGAIIGPSVIAMSLIGIYETGARTAGIWQYTDAPFLMLGDVPLFIMIAEGVMFGMLSYFVHRDSPLIGGLGFGVAITASYIGSFYLFAWLSVVL